MYGRSYRNVGRSADYQDSRTVADILSSMANGEPIPQAHAGPTWSSGVLTATTPTLTPTTLANIEQTFIELQSVPTVRTASQDLQTQSGFVPPIVDPMPSSRSQDYDYDNYDLSHDDSESMDSDWTPSDPKKSRGSPNKSYGTSLTTEKATPSKKGGRRGMNTSQLPPEEQQKRLMRRERNKLAAAKCRQRRVDHTNTLLTEVEGLEDKKSDIENEIQSLQQQKEQLEFILQAHKPMCKVSKVVIKQEVSSDTYCSSTSTSRPNSLPLSSSVSVKPELDIPITTPSSGVFTLGLDSMVDGHTGLTPAMEGHTGLTPLSTPTCSSQVQRNTNNSDSSPDNLVSPSTLMAL